MCEKENNFECALKIHYFVNIRNKNARVSGFTKNLKNYQKKKKKVGKVNLKAKEGEKKENISYQKNLQRTRLVALILIYK